MRDGARTRRTLLDEAMRLFVEQGFAETTTRDIAKACGISEGAIYRHFSTKDEIGWELFADNYASMADRLTEIWRAQSDFRGALRAIIDDLCRIFDHDPYRFRFLLLAQHTFLRRVRADMKSPIRVLRALIEQGIAQRQIGITDAALATAFAQGPLLLTASSIIYGALPGPMSRLAEQIYGATLRAIGGRATV
jgi:AcrR family transcriptional regulator